MRITAEQLTQIGGLVSIVSGLFPKKKKLRRLGELLTDAVTLQGPYRDAREKIDLAADAGTGVTLTVEETHALDAVMDAAGKVSAKVKKVLPS